MRRTRVRKQTGGMTMFPFLAVLMCTMGALVVLLVIMVQQARVQAKAVVTARAEEPLEEPDERERDQLDRRDDQQWRYEQLLASRKESLEDLASDQLRLGHLEEHIRRLREDLLRMARDAKALSDSGKSDRHDVQPFGDALARRREEIALAEAALREAENEARQRTRSFSIIPYEGPNGTPRRPIYLECQRDRLVLQPEGVVLFSRDFQKPLGPGNPLAAALRATREYWAGLESDGGAEPYPLLIVRPDGAETYVTARAAMKSWDSEFGYELVNAQMQLAFGPTDATLANVQRMAIEDARRRRERLAMIAPGRYGRPGGRYLHASYGDGGFVSGGDPVGSHGNHPGQTTDGEATGRGPNGGHNRDGNRGDGADGSGKGGFAEHRSLPGGNASGGSSESGGPNGSNGSGEMPQHSADGATSGQSDANGAASDGSPAGVPGGSPQKGATRQGEAGTGGSLASIAQTRGANWGLPNAAVGSTGFTRPVLVACDADRIVLLPERGTNDPARVIPVTEGTRQAVDEFVSALWQHMESWGIAGQRAYWRPVLRVRVEPGGERHFAELKALLNDSGIDVTRKTQ